MVSFIDYRILPLCLVLTLLAGCAGERAFNRGEKLVRQARYDEAVMQYSEAVQKTPDSDEYRMKLFATRNRAALEHLGHARELAAQQQYQPAINDYLQAVALDPSLETANQEMKQVQERIRADKLVVEAREFLRQRRHHQAKLSLDQALLLVPDHTAGRALLNEVRQASHTIIDGYELDISSTEPITLKFKDAKVKDVFKILSDLSGITFIFDEKINADRVSIQLESSTFSQALELLLKMNEMSMRVLNPKTVILYPKTKDKEKQYEDQLIQTFYLSNIDAKKAVNLLRTMLQLRKVYVHEEINALMVRDTPQVIKLAEQILEAADRSDAEVVFDLELVSVSGSDIQTLGAELSSYGVAAGLAKPGGNIVSNSLTSGGPTTGLVDSLSNLTAFYTLPTASFDLAKTLTSAETLANPKLRVKNKGKAKIHVGTREPIVTTTTGTDGNITSTNIQYVDVGTKLDIEPVIQLDDSVTTKLSLEVSQVLERQEVGQGNIALQIQTTNAQTELSLKDGERTVLGGLLQDNSSTTKKTIPFFGKIPLLGDLISHHDSTDQKREILLSITPHIVKKLDIPKADIASIWSGGEDDLRAGPSLSSFAVMLDAEQVKRPPAVVPANASISPMPPALPDTLQETLSPEEPVGTLPPEEPAEMQPPEEPAEMQPPEEPAEMQPLEESAEMQPLEESAEMQSLGEPEPGLGRSAEPDIAATNLAPVPVEPAQLVSRAFLDGPALVDPGQEFSLSVKIADVENLFSAPLFVKYDPELLDFQWVDEGEFLRQNGAATVFTTSPNPALGRIIVGYKQTAGGEGSSGSGELYRLVFTAKQAGRAVVTLEQVNFRDPSGKRLPVSAEGTLVEIR